MRLKYRKYYDKLKYFNFKTKIISISLISSSFFITINSCEFAEARTIPSARFFKGEYKDSIIYGALNDWDLRGCTVLPSCAQK